MSKTRRENHRRPAKGKNQPTRPERRISVRSVRRELYDLRSLGRTAIRLALAEAEEEKAAEVQQHSKRQRPTGVDDAVATLEGADGE
ncbi:hypothetical protein ACWDSJ_35890 [Nocardia sp. NPDC003482]